MSVGPHHQHLDTPHSHVSEKGAPDTGAPFFCAQTLSGPAFHRQVGVESGTPAGGSRFDAEVGSAHRLPGGELWLSWLLSGGFLYGVTGRTAMLQIQVPCRSRDDDGLHDQPATVLQLEMVDQDCQVGVVHRAASANSASNESVSIRVPAFSLLRALEVGIADDGAEGAIRAIHISASGDDGVQYEPPHRILDVDVIGEDVHVDFVDLDGPGKEVRPAVAAEVVIAWDLLVAVRALVSTRVANRAPVDIGGPGTGVPAGQ